MMQSVLLYGVHRAVSEPLAVSPIVMMIAVIVLAQHSSISAQLVFSKVISARSCSDRHLSALAYATDSSEYYSWCMTS
eukprot:5799-Heterococcus_DN1.PRE.2